MNEDTPGFEAIENALALVAPPLAGDVDEAVEVRMMETWDDFYAAMRVVEETFGMPSVSEEPYACATTTIGTRTTRGVDSSR